MPKGGIVDEATFRRIDKKLKENYGVIKKTVNETNWGTKTVSMVRQAKGNYEKFLELRAAKTEKRMQRNYKQKETGQFQSMEQNIHDILREEKCIKSILMKLAEAWGVKF